MAKVSVIIPVYNTEKYLIKCINTVISQKFHDIEIVIVNDGSTDNSEKIILEFKKTDSRIKYISKTNDGYGSVLETAIDYIDSEYFAICDSDDYLDTNMIYELYKDAKESNCDLVVADRFLTYEDENEVVNNILVTDNIIPNKKYEKQKDEYWAFLFFSPTPHSKLYKTELFKDMKFLHKTNFTDLTLYIMGLLKGNNILYINMPLSYYLINRKDSTTNDSSARMIKDSVRIFDDLVDKTASLDLPDEFYFRMLTQYVQLYDRAHLIIKDNKVLNDNIFKLDVILDFCIANKSRIIRSKKYGKFKNLDFIKIMKK